MKKHERHLATLLATAAVSATGCSDDRKPPEGYREARPLDKLTALTVGVHTPQDLALLVASRQAFREYNLVLNVVEFSTGWKNFNAVSAGDVNMAALDPAGLAWTYYLLPPDLLPPGAENLQISNPLVYRMAAGFVISDRDRTLEEVMGQRPRIAVVDPQLMEGASATFATGEVLKGMGYQEGRNYFYAPGQQDDPASIEVAVTQGSAVAGIVWDDMVWRMKARGNPVTEVTDLAQRLLPATSLVSRGNNTPEFQEALAGAMCEGTDEFRKFPAEGMTPFLIEHGADPGTVSQLFQGLTGFGLPKGNPAEAEEARTRILDLARNSGFYTDELPGRLVPFPVAKFDEGSGTCIVPDTAATAIAADRLLP
ncbi:MAG: hypothetical protein M3O22_03690 [Pseudomonadota bacterium]|nr:hypothetical protein [Pseudomonadota bacterium]